MHSSIGQNIKSHGVSGLQYPISDVQSPASVDKTVTSIIDRALPNLEHSFSVMCTNNFFEQVDWMQQLRSRCPSLGHDKLEVPRSNKT